MRISDWSSDVCSSDLVGRYLAAFPGHDEIDVLVFGHHLRDIAIIFDHDIDIARHQQILPVVLMEHRHIGLLRGQHVLALLQRCVVARVERMSTRLNSSHYIASRMPYYA